jgi:hypothetical protein
MRRVAKVGGEMPLSMEAVKRESKHYSCAGELAWPVACVGTILDTGTIDTLLVPVVPGTWYYGIDTSTSTSTRYHTVGRETEEKLEGATCIGVISKGKHVGG